MAIQEAGGWKRRILSGQTPENINDLIARAERITGDPNRFIQKLSSPVMTPFDEGAYALALVLAPLPNQLGVVRSAMGDESLVGIVNMCVDVMAQTATPEQVGEALRNADREEDLLILGLVALRQSMIRSQEENQQ